MTQLERFRANKDRFFKEHDHSPLTDEQRERFQGLAYYPEDESLRFEIQLDTEGISKEPRQIGMTTGEPREFIPAGKAHFDIYGEQVTFVVFREPGRGRYFLPFRDGTAGDETYPVGRYLDPQARPDGTLIVDFNMAYNPYCAYNDLFTCPIPPAENVTSVPIRAGEKNFPERD